MRALALLVAAGACVSAPAYHCTIDEQCLRGGVAGTCPATGYCAFPDGTCPSGQRYAADSDDLSGICLGEEPSEPDAAPGTCVLKAAAGAGHTCALLGDGTVRCWGDNGAGALGDGTTESHATPVVVADLTGVSDLAADADHTCARADGQVLCWGTAGGAVRLRPSTIAAIAEASQIVVGDAHACALAGGQVWCWGANDHGQLGVADVGDPESGRRVKKLSGVRALAAGGSSTCALLDDGVAKCWGEGIGGKLGNGAAADVPRPALSPVFAGAAEIALGSRHACARWSDGHVVCVGEDDLLQLGADGADGLSGAQVAGLPGTVTRIAAGGSHTCVLGGGEVVCWGANAHGQLGHGVVGEPGLPGPVTGLGAAAGLALGTQHSCALLEEDRLLCWGDDSDGQLGDGAPSAEPRPTPIAVSLCE
jgi:alpha-tubulin suppressor-like RCC1 family protein